MGIKKPAKFAGTCQVCNTDYKVNEDVFMQKDGEKWIICKDESCFKQQGGTVDEPKQKGKFTPSRLPLSKAPEVYAQAELLLNQFKEKRGNIPIEIEAQFVESMFKTLSSSYRE